MTPPFNRIKNMRNRLRKAGYDVKAEMNGRTFHRLVVKGNNKEVGISGISFSNLDDKQIYKNVVNRIGVIRNARKVHTSKQTTNVK